MPSMKRPRSPMSSSKPKTMKPSSKLMASLYICFHLISTPSAVNAFSVSASSSISNRNTVTAVFSPLFATSSTEISSNQKKKNYNKSTRKPSPTKLVTKSKEANYKLFQTYNQYKSIQEKLSQLNASKSSLAEQAASLNLSISTLETILVNGYNARQTLLLDNIPLVHHSVKKLTKNQMHHSLSREDLIQEGTIGLIKAIDKFDASLGNAFSTYAVYWIRASVTRCIQQKEDMIRVPEYLERAIRAVDSAMKDQGRMNWESKDMYASLDLDAIATSTGLTTRVVKEAMKVKQRRMLQASRKEGYTELQDYMMKGAKFQQQNDSGHAREGQLEHFKDILGQFLSMKEMEAISWRYGLLQEETMNIPEPVQVNIRECRDYEAEAERELFGSDSIFASANSSSAPAQPQVANKKLKATISVAPKNEATKGGRWGEAMSFKEVGVNMRVSAEYGRRLCSSALKKLQAAAEEGRLDPAMLF
jgi:RNA polymerase sigma factor (sigma-70 family)